jgi:deoxycytidine triphosphate deaminase
MTLGIEELHRLVAEHKLVEGLAERELKEPEGAGFDLRAGELYEISGKGFLGVQERETPDMRLVASFEKGDKVVIQPHTYYLVKTAESVNMPDDLLALMTPRSTLFRSGLFCFGGQVPPGYHGGLNMGLYNFREAPFELEMGARIVHIMFFEVKGKGNAYRGQWQGGRVTTENRERQV